MFEDEESLTTNALHVVNMTLRFAPKPPIRLLVRHRKEAVGFEFAPYSFLATHMSLPAAEPATITFAILYLTRHLPLYHTLLIIIFSLSLHLSFTPNLRLISSNNHSRLCLLAPLHSGFSGSLNLALFSFHITIIVNVSLISSHFICYTAYYCSIVSALCSFHQVSLLLGWLLQAL